MSDVRGIISVPGLDDVFFDTSPFLDADAVPAVVRFDTVIVTETELGDTYRYDRPDFFEYVDPFLPTVATANRIVFSHVRFVGDPSVLDFIQVTSMTQMEIYTVLENGGIQDAVRLNSAVFLTHVDSNHVINGLDLQVEVVTLGFAGTPTNINNIDKLVGKRQTEADV